MTLKILNLIAGFSILFACNIKSPEKKNNAVPDSTTQTKPKNTGQTADHLPFKEDSLIIHERIDGPANVRDTVNGNLLFTIHDNIPVIASAPVNNWCQVGLNIDLTKEEKDCLCVPEGSKLFVKGKLVGEVVNQARLNLAFHRDDSDIGQLSGYTAYTNIKKNTIPEIALQNIIESGQGIITLSDLQFYIKNFEFSTPGFLSDNQIRTFDIYEEDITEPSPSFRLILVFNSNDALVAVIHSRNLTLKNSKNIRLKNGFTCAAMNYADSELVKNIIDNFNSQIIQVG